MDPYRGFYRRFLNKRQGLGGILDGGNPVLSSSTQSARQATTAANPQNTGDSSGLGGLISQLTSDPSSLVPSLGTSSASTSSTPLTHSSSSLTGLTTSSVQTTSSTPSATSSSFSSTSTPKPTPTPSGAAVYTSSDGTSVVYLTSTLSSPSATTAPNKSFLQNPSLEGGVFTLVGIAVLIIAFIAVTWTLRKRRRDRLERDLAAAVTFDPGAAEHYERQEEAMEKRRLSRSSSGHSHSHGHSRVHGYGYGMQSAYAPQPYAGPMDYGRYPMPAYAAPRPNPAPYRAPSPTIAQPVQGGANLTRKFSDRKPVPPLFPDPTYNPTDAYTSTPSQFHPRE